MAVISTYGTVDNFVKSALLGLGATETDPNGRFYVDGSMVNVELSNVIAEAIYIGEIFRDGQSVTGKYTTDRKAGAVRVALDTPIPNSSRTLAYGGRQGTEGNSGIINVNPAILPANDEFMVYLNQVNDQSMLFPDLGKEYIPLDIMAKKISGYAKVVVEDRTASTLAEILSYAFFRALNSGDNLETISDLNAEDAYATAVANLNTKLDNGDITQGAHTFSTDGRTIIGRPTFINKVFNRKSGIILTGSDLAQEMLRSYDLDAKIGDKNYVGTGYKGYALGFHWQSCPDYIWTLAEKYLGLTAGSLSHVYAIAVSYEATAMGRIVDLGVKLIDATEVRGTKAQPLNVWGHEAFRKSFVVGDSNLTTSAIQGLGFSATVRKYPVAPKMANQSNAVIVPIFNGAGQIIGYKEVAEVPTPNGGNIGGVKIVATPTSETATTFESSTTVMLDCATPGATIYYTLDGKTPDRNSTLYTSAGISLSATKTVKAIAYKDDMVPSAEYSQTFTKS